MYSVEKEKEGNPSEAINTLPTLISPNAYPLYREFSSKQGVKKVRRLTVSFIVLRTFEDFTVLCIVLRKTRKGNPQKR